MKQGSITFWFKCESREVAKAERTGAELNRTRDIKDTKINYVIIVINIFKWYITIAYELAVQKVGSGRRTPIKVNIYF